MPLLYPLAVGLSVLLGCSDADKRRGAIEAATRFATIYARPTRDQNKVTAIVAKPSSKTSAATTSPVVTAAARKPAVTTPAVKTPAVKTPAVKTSRVTMPVKMPAAATCAVKTPMAKTATAPHESPRARWVPERIRSGGYSY